MTTYNHAFTLAFEVGGSTCPDGSDVSPQRMYEALIERVNRLLAEGQMLEAVGAPFDTYEERAE